MVMRFFRLMFLGSIIGALPSMAMAGSQLIIADASAVKWAVHGDRVYFRNLDEFDQSWLGCCYNYYIELTTDSGRAMFSAFIAKQVSGQPVNLYLENKAVPGHILMVGNW